MELDLFVDQVIEGYIFSDLETMSKCHGGEGMDHGDVGYPMVMTTLAGIELLGGLLLPRATSFSTSKGDKQFLGFWDDFFAEEFPVYSGFGELFYSLLRNGVAHTFAAKNGVYVTKATGAQLSYDDATKRVEIDSNVFACDLLSTYRGKVKPLLTIDDSAIDPNRDSMQLHLDQMTSFYERHSADEFSSLKPSEESILNHEQRFTMQIESTPVHGTSTPLVDDSGSRRPTISGMPTPGN